MANNVLNLSIVTNQRAENATVFNTIDDDDDDDDWSDETLAQTRYIIQRILVPCVVTIGIAGNLLTVVVLTRRRMRCSTNIYLTALALADIVNLFFAFILSLQRYPNYNYGHGIYWSSIGLSHWFHDASLYTSIYLTVSFTLERYISVCHPLRGQVLCTEARAKKVITVVVILCFLCTITTRFEYELKDYNAYFDYAADKPCTEAEANKTLTCKPTIYYNATPSNFSRSEGYQNFFYYPSTFFGTLLPFLLLTVLNSFLIWTVRKSQKMRHTMTNTRQTDTSQENKVTITLIAVVILFLVCQSPNALQLLHIMDLNVHSNRDLVLNNIFNLLIALNAASNFILYCVLSDKYRKTVKVIFCGLKPLRKNTLSSSRFTSARTTSSFYSRSYNGRSRQKEPKRFSISKEEYANLQAETEKLKKPRISVSIVTSPSSRTNSIAESGVAEEIPMRPVANPPKNDKHRMKNIRFSLTPSESKAKNKSNSDTAPMLRVDTTPGNLENIIECELVKPVTMSLPTTPSTPLIIQGQGHAQTNCFLHLSPSETSLHRSRSLNFPPKPKHAPDCKDNPLNQ